MHSLYRHLLVHGLLMIISVVLARQSPVIAAESRSPAKTEYQEGEVPAEPGLVTVQARQEPRPPMRELKTAVGDRFSIGVGIGHFVLDQAEDASLIKKHFQILTPENCMKPQGIQPEEGKFRYENTDKFIRFAESNDLDVVGHCLVWAKDDRTSAWMMTQDGDPVTAEKLIERINTHIDKVVGRYGEAVSMWDVVNEALADSEQEYLRDSVYTRTTGEDFLVKAFQFARAKDPDALLIYNDYNCHKSAKRKNLIRLLTSLKAKGAPVDAFGMQGHFELGKIPFEELRETFDQLRKLDMKVVVSELDIDVVQRGRWWAEGGKYRDELKSYDPYRDGCPDKILQEQAEQYAKLFELFSEYSDIIERVSFWNLHDGQSWLNYFPWRRANYPLLFDRDRQPKPAFAAVIEVLAGDPESQQTDVEPKKEPVTFTTREDHRNMLEQLGIAKLRPGPSGNADAPNAANYDETKANPYPDWPEILKLEDGQTVATPETWWNRRRPQIVDLFEKEVYGRVPKDVPAVKWTVKESRDAVAGGIPVIEQHIVGTADNSACPKIEVEISMSLTLPKEAGRPVPVLMMFGRTPFDPVPEWMQRFRRRGPGGSDRPRGPSRTDELIAAGWGCVMINPSTIQADNGAGLTRGIIGLTNHGQPRKPDDWGSLRAWGWGASRGLDYLQTNAKVDAKRVGIEGVSRYGKAALVTMAFDKRFAMVLVGSSGAGGATPHRRNFGEAVENLTGSGEYHWMAGMFLKYAAEESVFGSKNACDIPVDSHQLIALCAPRLTFVSYGIPEKGDANWLDQRGSYMATVAASPVFQLLGVKGLGTTDDYKNEPMPPVNQGLLDGHLAWRQHDGGHTDAPNMTHFINWAEEHFADN